MKTLQISTGLVLSLLASAALAQSAPTRATAKAFPGTRQMVAPGAAKAQINGMQSVESYQAVKPKNSLFEFAPVVGMTNSTFTDIEGINGTKIEAISGYQAGIDALVGRNQLQFETGVQYAERGAAFKNTPQTSTVGTLLSTSPYREDRSYRLKYLEIPAMARYSFMRRESSGNIFVKAGMVMGLLQDAKLKIDKADPLASQLRPLEQDAKSELNSTDLRWAAGVGGQVKMSDSISWLLQGDYQQSVSRINKNAQTADFFNGGFGVMTGILIDL